jgi:hypothetical protein
MKPFDYNYQQFVDIIEANYTSLELEILTMNADLLMEHLDFGNSFIEYD